MKKLRPLLFLAFAAVPCTPLVARGEHAAKAEEAKMQAVKHLLESRYANDLPSRGASLEATVVKVTNEFVVIKLTSGTGYLGTFRANGEGALFRKITRGGTTGWKPIK